MNSFVRATIVLIDRVQTSDDPANFHSGPDYDLYRINVECGPSEPFLVWFHQVNSYGLCRVGSTSHFMDFGGANAPDEGEVFELTFDEFFPSWLDVATAASKAEIASMANLAIMTLA
jgi:hypothetical protein